MPTLQLLLVGAALAVLHTPISAQSVQGHLRDGDGRALAGAYVVLRGADDVPVAATLTDASGAFFFAGAGAGPRSVSAEAVGHAVAEVEYDRGAGHVVMVAGNLRMQLPPAAITPDRRCRISGDAAARVTALWSEVRKALRATSLAEESGLHGQERRTWSRELDPDDLRTLNESMGPLTGFQPGSPFRSPPPEELAQYGFIQGGESDGYSFYAPDTRTLLSSVFTDSHCLGFTPSGPEAGWIGLTFRPRFEGGMDVEGTLWIDARTLGPQRLEYRYSDLPWSVKTDKVGGLVEFRRLQGGPWVVQRWWVRSPRVGVRSVRLTQWDEPRRQFGLSALVEDGGEVVRVRLQDGRVERLSTGGD